MLMEVILSRLLLILQSQGASDGKLQCCVFCGLPSLYNPFLCLSHLLLNSEQLLTYGNPQVSSTLSSLPAVRPQNCLGESSHHDNLSPLFVFPFLCLCYSSINVVHAHALNPVYGSHMSIEATTSLLSSCHCQWHVCNPYCKAIHSYEPKHDVFLVAQHNLQTHEHGHCHPLSYQIQSSPVTWKACLCLSSLCLRRTPSDPRHPEFFRWHSCPGSVCTFLQFLGQHSSLTLGGSLCSSSQGLCSCLCWCCRRFAADTSSGSSSNSIKLKFLQHRHFGDL